MSTVVSAEREAILRTLRETKGVLGGPRGAAVRLGLKRTTLSFLTTMTQPGSSFLTSMTQGSEGILTTLTYRWWLRS